MDATKDNTIRELKANWKLDSRVKGRVVQEVGRGRKIRGKDRKGVAAGGRKGHEWRAPRAAMRTTCN